MHFQLSLRCIAQINVFVCLFDSVCNIRMPVFRLFTGAITSYVRATKMCDLCINNSKRHRIFAIIIELACAVCKRQTTATLTVSIVCAKRRKIPIVITTVIIRPEA